METAPILDVLPLLQNGSDNSIPTLTLIFAPSYKAVVKAMRMETDHRLDELGEGEKTNNVFKLLKTMKKGGKDLEGGRCMRGNDGQLSFSATDRAKLWKEHMENFMNVENDWVM